jgi:type III secretion protein W
MLNRNLPAPQREMIRTETPIDRPHSWGANTSGLTGTLAGEQVFLNTNNPISMLENSREEISLHMADRVEDLKELKEWKFEGGEPTSLLDIKRITEYLDSVDPNQHLRNEAKRRLQNGSPLGSILELKNRPPADRAAIYQFAMRGADERVREELADELEELELRSGPEIRAAFNTTTAARAFAPTPESFHHFQKTYADIVLGKPKLSETLKMLLEEHMAGAEGERFESGLQAMLSALGAELKATRPSTDVTRLHALVQDIYQLEAMVTVLEECELFSASMLARFGEPRVLPLQLLQELVALVNERWIVPQRLRDMAAKFRMKELLARIAFHSNSRKLLRGMPVKVFNDQDSRQALLDTAQTVLDEAISEEEERAGE